MTTPPRPVAQRFPKTTLGVAFVIGLGVGAFVACGEDDNGPSHAAPRVLIPVHDTTPTRLAVLVGIGHYAESTQCPVADLPGPANDVSLVKKLLMDRFAFQERDIVTLEDKLATHRNIVDVFHRHLIQKAGPETEVVFWFSGHGSRTKDRSGREKGGMDSTLLAYDSRAIAPDGSYDVTDDEIRSLLEALAERTSRITLITDNCHSGGVVRGSDNNNRNNTATRGVAAGTSALMDERVAAFWPGAIPLLDDDDKRRADISRRFVHVAACTRDQLARGWRVPQESGPDRHYGTLTWFLVQALNRVQKGESWRDVLLRVQLLLSCHRPGQTPVPDGNCDRMVFGGDFKPRPDGLVAMPLGGDRLSIRGGSLHGLCVGSTVEVRKPFGQEALGQAKVEFVHPGGVRSMARWTGGRPDGVEKHQALWATETSRPQDLPPLRLHVDVASPELATSLEKSSWVQLVPRAKATYLLSKTGDASMRLQQVDGPVLWQGETEALDAAFQHELRYQAVVRLPMQPGGLKLRAKFVDPTPKELDGSDFGQSWHYTPVAIRPLQDSPRLGQQPPPASQHHYQAEAASPEDFPHQEGKPPSGELAVLEVTNASSKEVHLSVISLEESRTANVVWPWILKGETLKPGKSRRVPIWLVGDKAFGKRRMRDRYVILGTLAEFDAEALIQNKSEPTRSAGAPVPAILQQALAAKIDLTRSDSGNQVPVRERNWGSTWLDVHVQYKAPKKQQ